MVSHEQIDDYTLESLRRAQTATQNGYFNNEITTITMTGRKADTLVEHNKQLASAKPDKVRHLKPVFSKDGSVTAANSSSISDGAASMLVVSEDALMYTSWVHQVPESM